jgi:flagellar basal body rod protein FlgG
LDASATPITGLDPRSAIEIGAAGEIRQNGREVARLGIVIAADSSSLQKRGALYFSSSEPGATLSPSQAEVLQGRLETSNVAGPVAAVRLIDVLRQFETLQKAVQINSEMSQRLDEIARVGN